jgi:hypothetical protein
MHRITLQCSNPNNESHGGATLKHVSPIFHHAQPDIDDAQFCDAHNTPLKKIP